MNQLYICLLSSVPQAMFTPTAASNDGGRGAASRPAIPDFCTIPPILSLMQLNNCCGHFSPLKEDSVDLKEGDVAKM
jgi:hypothetical protein